MDEDLYDEFGNYIGPSLEDEEDQFIDTMQNGERRDEYDEDFEDDVDDVRIS